MDCDNKAPVRLMSREPIRPEGTGSAETRRWMRYGTKGNMLFPTMVVGSLPRPRWVMDLIEDRKFGRIGVEEADLLLDDAVPLAIRMQERRVSTLSRTASGDGRAT